jgi:ketosteroid isomerase-like protein
VAEQDVDLFRRALDAYNRHDLAGFIEICDPSIESYPITAAAEGDAYHGHEGIRRWWRNMDETWGGSIHATADDVRDLGDCVLALGRLTARGLGSGVEIDSELGWLIEFRDGLVARWWAFTRHADALEAARARGRAT